MFRSIRSVEIDPVLLDHRREARILRHTRLIKGGFMNYEVHGTFTK